MTSDMDYTGKSLKAKMRRADKLKAKFVLIIGEDEMKKGEYILRDMSSSEQCSSKKENIVEELSERLKRVNEKSQIQILPNPKQIPNPKSKM